MTEKVLGFLEKDVKLRQIGREGLAWKHYAVDINNLVPVVSVEEYNREIEKLRKHLDSVIAFRDKKFISVEWLEKEILKHSNCKNYHSINGLQATCLDMVFSAIRKKQKR